MAKITVVTPFSRAENLPYLEKILKDKVNWIVLQAKDETPAEIPWATVKSYEVAKDYRSNRLFNAFISDGLEEETQYMILCDDDSVEQGFFGRIPDAEAVCVSMKRSDRAIRHVVWTDFERQMGHWEDSVDILIAAPENMKAGRVGGEQLIMKGKALRNFRYGLSNIGDGKMIEKVAEEYAITYVPDAYVLFNYFEDGRYESFKREKPDRTKPVVLFVGDYWCAGNPQMGLSEWEGNIWSSLESTGLAEVARFHFDKFYYHTGKRPDQALIERIEEIKPDYILAIIYKFPGSSPTVIHPDTLGVIKLMGIPVITIWGDLEAEQQRAIASLVKPYIWKGIGTARQDVVKSVGFRYMHVPKDPRIWNNPQVPRDIDALFFGSYGLGREERQKALQSLLDASISLVCGGSEGRDHYTTEQYAEGYKRAKIALSFSRAHGMNVVNARPFEAMSCGAMLMEQESPELAKLYTPGVDYVEWKDEVDLVEKTKYYLEHEEERKAIAEAGWKRTLELYSAKSFWEEALKR